MLPALLACALQAIVIPPDPPFAFERHDYALGGSPVFVDAADVDGDGKLDLLAANPALSQVQVLHGTGGGALGAPVGYAVQAAPAALAVGDVDGNGSPDVLAACTAQDELRLLVNGPTGLALSGVWGTGASPRWIEAQDFDGDGDLDLALAQYGADNVRILLGDGAGGFSNLADHSVPGNPDYVRAADIDNDGSADLGLGIFQVFALYELLGDGQGGFSGMYGGYFPGGWLESLAFGDMDQDGNVDVMGPANDGFASDTTLEFQLGDGAGSFSQWSFVGVIGASVANDLADLNGDGLLDSASLLSAGTVRVLPGHPGAGFGSGQAFAVPASALHERVADFDADGRPDLATAGTIGTATLLLNRTVDPGPPSVSAVVPASMPAVVVGPQSVTLTGADLAYTTTLRVANQPVPYAVSGSGASASVIFNMPLVAQLGPVPILLASPWGTGNASIDVAPVSGPVLEIGDGLTGQTFAVGSELPATLGWAPGDLGFLFASVVKQPTVLPGLLDLGIGAGGSALFLLWTAPIGAQTGWAQAVFTIASSVGAQVHFQAAFYSLAAGKLPLLQSHVQTVFVE